jgi:ribosomal protein L1
MAKAKSELLNEAKELKLDVTEKNTVAEITEAIKKAENPNGDIKEAEKVDKPTAKSGKRSEKGLKEAEKIEKQHSDESDEVEKKPDKKPEKPARSRLERRAKGYRKSAELIDKAKQYKLSESLELAAKTSHVKFDASVELHIRLGVDPRQADQNIRDNVVLPSGTGKTVKVAILDDDLLAKIDKGEIEFDVLIAKPDQMQKLAKYARVLGPKGLMPNPKSGTVTTDTAKAAEQAKAGKIEYRVDSTGIVHVAIGKVSFGASKLAINANAVMESIKNNRPASVKGIYIQSLTVTTSMGPGISVSTTDL